MSEHAPESYESLSTNLNMTGSEQT